MTTPPAAPPRGRRRECDALDGLLTGVRSGVSGVLVLRGDAGVGKSVLLEYLSGRSGGCGLARTAGVESEMELAFAGLQQLCAPWLDRLDDLPGPQAGALGTAFGLRAGDAPDAFLVGLAVLSLLAEVAEERPLLCVVDDAQWLDRASAQALAFAARRLAAEAVGVVFAVREPAAQPVLAGLPDLLVGGLEPEDARALLDAAVTGPLDARVRDRIVDETHGNPLALLELPRGLSHDELAGGFGLVAAAALPGRIEESFLRQLTPLDAATRRLLLVAAAEPLGDAGLVWRAAGGLGIAPEAAGGAIAAGLVRINGHISFRHPLLRSAVYRGATPEERRSAHHALADATDPGTDPDRRAWHRGQATTGLDEAVAEELERSADRARARGGLAAAAAFHERAAALTPEPARRARRTLAAAQRKHQAGAPEAALRLLGTAEAGPLDELELAQAELLRAQLAFAVTHGRDAPRLLLAAARRLEPLDATLARETYLDAFSAALFAGRLARGGGMLELSQAVVAARWGPGTRPFPRACALLLEGLAVFTTAGYVAGAPILRRALETFADEPMSEEDGLRWLWLACRTARALGDDARWELLTERHVRLARRAGALSLLPIALSERFNVRLLMGDVEAASSLVAEAEAVIEATGSHLSPRARMHLATWRGRDEDALALIEASREDVERRGEGVWLVALEWSRAALCNAIGQYEEALAAAERAAEHPHAFGFSTWVPTELIEAAARSGHPERATGAMARLGEMAQASGSEWLLGVAANCRALLSTGPEAEALHLEAIERLGRTGIVIQEARARLVYGEWLRRSRRRTDAREQLRTAHRMLTDMGADGFAERARRELLATGETARRRVAETLDDLTAQEAQIARLASEGQTNPEIGAQLFLSPRTVEWHLRKVFGKLGITSRRELVRALPRAAPA